MTTTTPAPIHTPADPAPATTRHTRQAKHPRTTRTHPAATTRPRPPTGLPDVPNSIPALIAKIVESLTWDKTLQVAFLIGVIAIAVSLVLVVLTYTLSAVPPIWSAIVSLIVGGGAVTITYRRTTLPPHHAAPGGDARGRPGIVEVDCSCGCDVSDFSPSG